MTAQACYTMDLGQAPIVYEDKCDTQRDRLNSSPSKL